MNYLSFWNTIHYSQTFHCVQFPCLLFSSNFSSYCALVFFFYSTGVPFLLSVPYLCYLCRLHYSVLNLNLFHSVGLVKWPTISWGLNTMFQYWRKQRLIKWAVFFTSLEKACGCKVTLSFANLIISTGSLYTYIMQAHMGVV